MEANKLYDYNVNERVIQLGLNLKILNNPIKNSYLHNQRTGNLLFLSGKISQREDNSFIIGKVGKNLTTKQGEEAARLVAISQLSALQTELGNLNKVVRIVKVFGMINSATNFSEHATIMDGFSDLIVEIFGERGKHARVGIGVSSLPANAAIEVDMIVGITD